MSTETDVSPVAPAVSVYKKVKVWDEPFPALGVTETVCTCAPTVQLPSNCQAAVPFGFTACM